MTDRIITKAALIGDVDAEDDRLAAALAFINGQGIDNILCVGDIVDGPGDPKRCAELLRAASAICVRGNHDRWLLSGSMRDLPEATDYTSLSVDLREFLLSLPTSVSFATPLGRAQLCHGLGSNDMCRLLPDDYGYALSSNDKLQKLLAARDYRIVIGGHTHRSMVRHFGHLVVINPGTLLRRHDPQFAIADFETGRVDFHEFDDNLDVIPSRQCPDPLWMTNNPTP